MWENSGTCKKTKRALLIINPQNGYLESPSSLLDARQVLRAICRVKNSPDFDVVYVTRDTRLLNDVSFSNCTPGKEKGERGRALSP